MIKKLSIPQNPERLIVKDIKKYTDFGEEYNSLSLMDTIQECLDEDITIEIDASKSLKDGSVKYLRLAKILQDEKRLNAEQEALNAKKRQLQQEKSDVLKY